jgi:hypothetical protein
VNGVNIPQAIDSVFKTTELANNDVVSAILFSSYECLSSNNVSSNTISMVVNPTNFNINFSADTQNPTPGSSFAVNLTNTTTNTVNKEFTWFFGDGSSYVGANPITHLYPSDGSYTVALKAMDTQTGCVDSTSKTNYISCVGGTICGQSVSITPTTQTIDGCIGGNVTLSCTTNAVNATYQWNKNGVILGGETDSNLITSSPGSYSVTVYSNGGCPVTSSARQVTFTQPTPTAPIITSSGTLMSCVEDSITLTVTGNFNKYLWNTGDTTQSILVKYSGIYSVMGINSNGCNRQADPIAVNNSFVESPAICMVTVDEVTGENLLVWEKPVTTLIDSFIIFKEVAPFVYKRIISQPYSALSEVIDTSSTPMIHDDVYKLVAIDTCGNFTLPSIFHRTMHLQVNPGIGTSRVLSWNSEAGFNAAAYIIMRGKPGQMQQIDVISPNQNTYIDYPNAATLANNDTVYRIDVMLPNGGCNSSKNNVIKIRATSNNSTNKVIAIPFDVGYLELNQAINFSLYPNPSNDIVTIETDKSNVQYTITDLLGKKVLSGILIQNKSQLDVSSFADGVYFIELTNGTNRTTQKLIVE